MLHGVGDGFLADSVKCIGGAKGHGAHVSVTFRDDLDGASLHHFVGTGLKRGEQIIVLQRLGPQYGNTAARFFMAVVDQIAGQIELAVRAGHVRWNTVSNCLQLKADAGKALRQRVVHLMGESFSLFHDCTKAPMFDAAI